MPTTVPVVEIYAGDTFAWPTYTFKNEQGAVIDLVADGWTNWSAQWRAKANAPEFIQLTVDTTGAATGKISLLAEPEQTRAMNGPGVWDIQAEDGEVVKTWLRGPTKWVGDVTRDGS